MPDAADSSYLRRRMRRLVEADLAQAVGARRGWHRPESAWFLTQDGAAAVEASGEMRARRPRITPARAAGMAQGRLLAVNEVGVLFVEAARARGDECGPLDWTLEVAHRSRNGLPARLADDRLVVDALLHYTVVNPGGGRVQMRFFIELDRARMAPATLARKIDLYARYYTYVPTNDQRKRLADEPNRPASEEIYPPVPQAAGRPRRQAAQRARGPDP